MGPPTKVIAHRGASAYLPEHTLEAKALAHGQGADYLEQDVVASRDGIAIVCHDIYLDAVTDVAERFPGRARGDGRHYAVDFDWREIQTLEARARTAPGGRSAAHPERFPVDAQCGFRIASLREELAFVAGLNASTGRSVGIYPEIKEPAWHHRHGIDLSRIVLDTLGEFGYGERGGAAIVQCFDAEELRRVRAELGCSLPLVQLVDAPEISAYAAQGWEALADYADGVGIGYPDLIDLAAGRVRRANATFAALKASGLEIHPFTFNRESAQSLSLELEALLAFFMHTLRVEAVFCDLPDVAVAARAQGAAPA